MLIKEPTHASKSVVCLLIARPTSEPGNYFREREVARGERGGDRGGERGGREEGGREDEYL